MTWIFRNVFVDPDESSRVPGSQKPSTFMSVAVGMFAAVGGFIYGYDTGLVNSVSEMSYVRQHFSANGFAFTAKEQAIITSILSLGTFFGALAAPLLSDTFGRRWAIIISTFLIFMIGNICQICSTGIPLLCIGRFITGLAVGIVSAVVPLYQAEAAPKFARGAVVSTYQWAITWGLLVSSAVSQGTHNMDSAASYRVPMALQFVWSLVLGVGMVLLPESPRFFIRKNDLNAAARSLSRLRRVPTDDPALIEELVEIKANHDYELSFGSHSFSDCFTSDKARPHQLKRLFTGVILQAIQQCSGINFIFYYGVNFFSRTGVSQSYLISLITYLVNAVFTIPGIILVETIGRRRILIAGGLVMGIANLIIAVVGVTTNSVIANKVMIAFVCMFIASFAASWGPVVWVVCGEIFSLGVRAKAVAITASSNWLVNFVFAYITPYLIDTGTHTAALGTKIFFIWGGFNFIGVGFVYFMTYETKGLSLEEIDELYRSCPSAIASSDFKVEPTFNNEERNTTANSVSDIHGDNRDSSEKKEDSSNGWSLPDSQTSNASPQAVLDSPYEFGSVGVGSSYHQAGEEGQDDQRIEGSTYGYTRYEGYDVDLGYGLGLTQQSRGPPSLMTVTTDEEGSQYDGETQSAGSPNCTSLSEYVTRLSTMSDRRSFRGALNTEEDDNSSDPTDSATEENTDNDENNNNNNNNNDDDDNNENYNNDNINEN